jgi:hypothetical protein
MPTRVSVGMCGGAESTGSSHAHAKGLGMAPDARLFGFSLAAQAFANLINDALIVAKEIDVLIVTEERIRVIRLSQDVAAPAI